ncbi:MAG TPA: TerY-C metal binding domain-containing protein [Candidatus Elarobacter sp.]|jgi:uncharacterized protein YegL
MRRLPIYFVLDVSESMVGENHVRLERGLGTVVRQLRQDPFALETVFVSVIAFAGKAKTLRPLLELVDFTPPELPAGGGTALGKALEHLMAELESNVTRTTAEKKGDWRPIVFLMTDGHPTDDPAPAIRRWNERWRGRAHLVAISVGDGADARMLAEVADDVIILEDTGEAGFANCVRWITQSISVNSRPVERDAGTQFRSPDLGISLAKFEPSKSAPARSKFDERFAIFTGRCQRSRAPYLLKYESIAGDGAGTYKSIGAYALAESFFELSDAGAATGAVSVTDLIDSAPCPHCGNPDSLSQCSCGRLLCTDGPGNHTCPWCEQTATFEPGVFGVDRGRG